MQQLTRINKDIHLEGVQNFQQTTIAPFMIQSLSKCGFMRPTPIQYHSINNFAKYPQHSIIAQSKSGTGKTLAFLVPILNSLCESNNFQNQTICVIILPTRQLSIQVHQYLKQLITSAYEIKALPAQKQFKSRLKSISSLLTIGGIPIEDDKKTLLASGANFVIGTVGRIYQLMESGYLKPDHFRYVIFDEGDKLFATKDQKLEKILKRIQNSLKNRKTDSHNQKFKFMVYSATYDQKSVKKITDILSKILTNQSNKQPNILHIQTLTNSITNQFVEKVTQNWRQLNFVTFHKNAPQVQQQNQYKLSQKPTVKETNQNTELINLENIKKFCIQLDNNKKSLIVRKCDKLKQILSQLSFKKCMIFVQKKALLQQIHDQLKQFQPLLIHGSLSQALRIKAMNQANKSKIVISSDLLARGIDLVLDLVILFDANINETFWHRIGRTGRFGRVGVVVSLDRIQNWQSYEVGKINEILKDSVVEETGMRKNEWYGTYMTEYGRWQDVSVQKEEILNKGYNFYDEEKVELSKRSKKQMKQIEKKIEKEQSSCNKTEKEITLNITDHKHEKLQLRGEFSSQKQFIDHYSQIFNCRSCCKLIEKIRDLSGKDFEILKYFMVKQY